MKKFNADGPELGLFDFNKSRGKLTKSATVPPVVISAKEWEVVCAAPATPNGVYRNFGKQLLDCALVIASLPFTLPVILLCAIALWIESGQPFYGCCHVNSASLQIGMPIVDQATFAADFHASNASSRW
ncbi:hypothetical protein SAMN04488523_11583 [Sulfitobacter brevis]|uniref:Uncharacterized protein n=1 Tax=Sulfitobacter brevis TaxID=74348 RepID=A0A1I2FFP8_9RHOB|nr:sugar transferase [Sulfitobacter brevis]SFF03729.1 hypothetical protein SAMN04488523_11583 [Sulfitobacter brevis]